MCVFFCLWFFVCFCVFFVLFFVGGGFVWVLFLFFFGGCGWGVAEPLISETTETVLEYPVPL